MRIHRQLFIAAAMVCLLIIGCTTARIVGGPISDAGLKDGVYDGKANQGPVAVQVNVTIENQRIADIDVVKHRTMQGWEAESIIPSRIIEKQSTKVDAVAGATMSSTAIMNAVQDAVQKAK